MLRLIWAALSIYAIYAALLFSLQRRVLYPGAHLGPGPYAQRPPAEAEPVSLATAGGRVEAWFVPAAGQNADGGLAPGDRAPAAVVFHGNAEFAPHVAAHLGTGLRELGVSALYVEYPGFGGSEGRPSEASIIEAATAGYDWLAGRASVDSTRLFALGRSLGASVAAGLSRRRPLAALVLWSPLVSVPHLALRRYAVPPFLARDRWDSKGAVSAFAGPVLIFHGRHDRVIPFGHAEILAEEAADVELVPWACEHNDCPPSARELWAPLGDFLSRRGIVAVRPRALSGPGSSP